MTRFKVGDKVVAIGASHGWGAVKKGDVGVVVNSNLGGCLVDFPSHLDWSARHGDLKLHRPLILENK